MSRAVFRDDELERFEARVGREEVFGRRFVETELGSIPKLVGEAVRDYKLWKKSVAASASVEVEALQVTYLWPSPSDDLEKTVVLLQAFGDDFISSCRP